MSNMMMVRILNHHDWYIEYYKLRKMGKMGTTDFIFRVIIYNNLLPGLIHEYDGAQSIIYNERCLPTIIVTFSDVWHYWTVIYSVIFSKGHESHHHKIFIKKCSCGKPPWHWPLGMHSSLNFIKRCLKYFRLVVYNQHLLNIYHCI